MKLEDVGHFLKDKVLVSVQWGLLNSSRPIPSITDPDPVIHNYL